MRGGKPIYNWERAAELYATGCNDHEIARQIGCAPGTCCAWRERTGRPPLIVKRLDGSVKDKVLALRNNGLTTRQIADRCGVCTGYVRATFQRADNPERTRQWAREAIRRHNALIGRERV